MKITADLLREMIEEELKEAGAVGDELTLNMIHGVLNTILAKHGGNYEAASQSPEWQVALRHGESARKSSLSAPTQQQQATMAQKKSQDSLARIRATLAAKRQPVPAQKPSTVTKVFKKPQEDRNSIALAKTQKMPESKLMETIRTLVREALTEAKKQNG